VSSEGVKIFSLSVDTVGFFARSLDDLELLASVFALQDDDESENGAPLAIGECKIGILKTMVWPKAGPGTIAAMDLAAKILKKAGAEVEELTLPAEFDSMPVDHELVVAGDARATFLNEHRVHRNELGRELNDYVQNSSQMSWKQHLNARDKIATLRPIFDSISEQYTAILTPSVVDEAPPGIEHTGNPAFNSIFTVCGAHMDKLEDTDDLLVATCSCYQYPCLQRG